MSHASLIETVNTLKKEIDELQAQLFYTINEVTDKAIALNVANAKIADLQKSNDGLLVVIEKLETKLEESDHENDDLLARIETTEDEKADAEDLVEQKERLLQIALRTLNATERELLMVENSARPRELLLSMVA
jgi:chromosome segregation ATPase